MNPAITNLMLSLGLMQVLRKVDFEDPQILFITRVAYVASQLIIVGIYYYASVVIKRKNDTKTLKYVEPKGPMSQEPATPVTTTVRDYDLTETSKAMRSVMIGIAMMGVMHLYFHYVQPLGMQSIMTLKSLYEAKIVQIHIFGKPAVGDLKRPFEAPPSFMAAAAPKAEEAVASVEAKKTK